MTTNSRSTVSVQEMAETHDGSQEQSRDVWSVEGASAYQPIIGIPILVKQESQGPVLMADAVGVWAVERMRARVFLIPLWPFPTHTHTYQSLWSLMQSIDGLLLPAGIQGTDWYTVWKADEHEPGSESWPIAWEMALAQLATYMGMPVLAIADGAEKWNCALGGTRRESPGESEPMTTLPPENWTRHTIRVRAQSALASVLQPAIRSQDGEQEPWELACMPQQGIEHLAPGLRSCAKTEDGWMVAFERSDGVFGLGILGRLDWGLDQKYGTAVFEAFLQACRTFDDARRQQEGWQSMRDELCSRISTLVAQNLPLLSNRHQLT
ncbi:gamma-glutamyl-gamma-aminobutyrate hydrolase [Dictyobacter aurantiacus]|uniref:Gamma-glutamyl-gamma-aminobutyrate hydrolase n=2 Tax=Dictyobacter aurantiacus TaxID=1936993 RepID=A0A401ZQJ2_9CHLR|nr:gamma-glutamyl-gamma-aminobutyrate hydrolase [Dictyobacter aurantiacus]